MRRFLSLCVCLAATAAFAVHDNELPSWFPTQGLFSINPDKTTAETYGKATFTVARAGSDEPGSVEAAGHHYQTSLYPLGNPEQWTWNGKTQWKALLPHLQKQGFQVVYLKQDGDAVEATLRKGTEAATYVSVKLSAEDPYSNDLEIVEPAAQSLTVTLKPPAAKPEKVSEREDFPYLTALPGATLLDTQQFSDPLDVTASQEPEPHLVGSGTTLKMYRGPEGLSNLSFVDAYAPALKKAGWTVTEQNPQQGFLIAHYGGNGRDVWVRLSREIDRWNVVVADVGSSLRADLERHCKVAVYGVNFDFDKATLRPDAEPVLKQVLAVFKSEPKLSVEIGGHTDNVGKSDYNQSLSGRRADAVKAWLVKHGVAAGRLTSHGYGDTAPVVPNDSDAHRAKNRRVELKKPHCQG